jgi:RNA polymerase sigma-70 factor (ECF subfamily)
MDRDDGANRRSQTLTQYAVALRQPLLGWFLRRIADPSDAEDLVQEVLLRVTQLDQLEHIEHIDRYLYRTAASVLADRRRRRAVRQQDAHVPFDPERDAAEVPDVHRTAEGREGVRKATEALRSLPERTRIVFVLRRLEELPYQDIARRLGISVSAVEKHMQKAVAHLAAAAGDYR